MEILCITVVILVMPLAHSKVTSQGQISIPLDIRKRLGIGPGSVIEWHQDGDRLIVRRSARFSSDEVHRALFPEKAARKTLAELKEGIRQHARVRHARR